MKQFLAVGISDDDMAALTWSVATDSKDPQVVANELAEHNGNGTPEQILLIENGDPAPNVVEHWNLGKHYDEVS